MASLFAQYKLYESLPIFYNCLIRSPMLVTVIDMALVPWLPWLIVLSICSVPWLCLKDPQKVDDTIYPELLRSQSSVFVLATETRKTLH